MPAALALFIQALPMLLKIGQSVPTIMTYVKGMRDNFEQEGQWTEEGKKIFRDSLEALKKDPAWQPPPEPVPPGKDN